MHILFFIIDYFFLFIKTATYLYVAVSKPLYFDYILFVLIFVYSYVLSKRTVACIQFCCVFHISATNCRPVCVYPQEAVGWPLWPPTALHTRRQLVDPAYSEVIIILTRILSVQESVNHNI